MTMRGWYDVKAYGAAGDGSTDDTAAIDAAIAAINGAGGGVLFFPPGTYQVSSALTTLTVGCTVVGCGQGGWGWNDGLMDAVSIIRGTSQTAKLFTSSAQFFSMEGLAVVNVSGTTPSGGSAIHGYGNDDYRMQMNIRECLFEGWYDTIDSQVTGTTNIVNVNIYNPVRYGIRIRNTEEIDSGGLSLLMCHIGDSAATAAHGVQIETSGGHKMVGLTTGGMARGVNLDAAAASSIILISASSFEGYGDTGIYLDGNGHHYTMVAIQGCEFGHYGTPTGYAIFTDDIYYVSVAGCVFARNGGSTTAIRLTNGANGYIAPMLANGFSTRVSTSSFTSLDDDSAGA